MASNDSEVVEALTDAKNALDRAAQLLGKNRVQHSSTTSGFSDHVNTAAEVEAAREGTASALKRWRKLTGAAHPDDEPGYVVVDTDENVVVRTGTKGECRDHADNRNNKVVGNGGAECYSVMKEDEAVREGYKSQSAA